MLKSTRTSRNIKNFLYIKYFETMNVMNIIIEGKNYAYDCKGPRLQIVMLENNLFENTGI